MRRLASGQDPDRSMQNKHLDLFAWNTGGSMSRRLAQNQSTERPLKVLDDILYVLYTYREADEPWRNPGCSPLFVTLVSMYHGSRVRNQRLNSSQTHGQ